MPDIDKLKNEIFGLLKNEIKDFWQEEDDVFLSQMATDIAREKVLAATSANPKEHERNLLHLAATVQSEVTRKKLKIGKKSEDLLVRVISTVIRTIALSALGIA